MVCYFIEKVGEIALITHTEHQASLNRQVAFETVGIGRWKRFGDIFEERASRRVAPMGFKESEGDAR